MKKLIIALFFVILSTTAWSQDFSFDGNPSNNLIYLSQMIDDGEEVTKKETPKQAITSWNFDRTEIGLGIFFLIMGMLSVCGETPYRKK